MSSKEIALIAPRSNWMHGDIPYPPLGIAALSAINLKNNTPTTIIDGQFADFDQKLEVLLSSSRPLLVGISSTLLQLPEALKVAERIKNTKATAVVVLGGAGASCLPPQDFFDYSGSLVDAIVIGEGDYTWLEISKRALAGDEISTRQLRYFFEGTRGVAFRDGKDIVINSPRSRIRDLDGLPMPDLNGVRARNYIAEWEENSGMSSISIFPSRGCPFPCIFCDKSVFGKQFVHHSSGRIVDEMERITEEYGRVDDIFLFDDNLTTNRNLMLGVTDEIARRCLDVSWSLQARVDTVDEELLREMHSAGCKYIYFGIEATTQRLIDYLGKGFRLEQAELAIDLCKKNGIIPGAFFIVGIPGETNNDIEEMANFIRKTELGYVGFSILTPFPGTELYERTKHLIKPELIDRFELWDDTRSSIYQEGMFEVDPMMAIKYLNEVFKQMLRETGREHDPSQFVIDR